MEGAKCRPIAVVARRDCNKGHWWENWAVNFGRIHTLIDKPKILQHLGDRQFIGLSLSFSGTNSVYYPDLFLHQLDVGSTRTPAIRIRHSFTCADGRIATMAPSATMSVKEYNEQQKHPARDDAVG